MLDPSADLEHCPVTLKEEFLVSFVILHLASTLEATRYGAIKPLSGLEVDVKEFFSLPIPTAVWSTRRPLQGKMLVRFVDELLE